MYTVTKDPAAELDYGFDWSQWLTGNEEIASVAWVVPDGIIPFDEEFSSTQAKIWLRGGTVGKSYKITCQIVTNSSPERVDERSFTVSVRNR